MRGRRSPVYRSRAAQRHKPAQDPRVRLRERRPLFPGLTGPRVPFDGPQGRWPGGAHLEPANEAAAAASHVGIFAPVSKKTRHRNSLKFVYTLFLSSKELFFGVLTTPASPRFPGSNSPVAFLREQFPPATRYYYVQQLLRLLFE